MLKEDVCEGGNLATCYDDGDATANLPCGVIPDVIPHLCKFLGIEDIKVCRLVCKSWNYGATPVLRARAVIQITLYSKIYENFASRQEVEGRWVEMCERLKFCPIKIRLCNPYRYSITSIPPIDLETFPPVKKLKYIRTDLRNGKDWQTEQWQTDLCHKIILDSSTTLEKLWFIWDSDEDFPSFGGYTFAKLKKLRIFDRQGCRNQSRERIGQALTEAFPGLESLHMKGKNLYEISKMNILPKFPLSLTSLWLTGYFNTNGMECLLQIPAPLKKLVFHLISLEGNDDRVDELDTIFYKLLHKHSPSLEKLSVDIRWTLFRADLEWKVPTFPALKSLKILGSDLFENLEFEVGPGSGNFGRIDYKACFPVLEKLHVSNRLDDFSSVAAFLPEDRSAVVESVKDVNLNFLGDRFTNVDILAQTELYTRLLDIFPNARDSIGILSRKLEN